MTRGESKKSSAVERIAELRREIRHHDHLYHVLDRPEIADEAYDAMYAKLFELERAHPELVTGDSPTQRVGASPRDGFVTAAHAARMMSLEATRREEDVRRFDRRMRTALGDDVSYVAEPKLDGLSLEAVYEDGRLARAVTRGDGARGELVTENARTIRSIPLRLRGRAPAFVSVRGEVLMGVRAFEKLNRQLVEHGVEPFANPRNAAAGSMRQMDARITAERSLAFVAYTILAVDGQRFDTEHSALEALAGWGFRLPEPVERVAGVDDILRYHRARSEERDTLDWEIDGVVVKVDDVGGRSRLGATSHHPRWALAYKFEPRAQLTRVEDIAVQVGRTGALTPVALLRPVEVGGVTVSRATLHNRQEIARKDIRVGDRVRIQRAGDVIPEVVERVLQRGIRRRGPYRMPKLCPACGTPVATDGPLTYCPNRFDCPAQRVGRIVHFGSTDAMNIEGLGEETVRLLVERGLVAEPADLYALEPDDLLALPRFGERSARKLVASIRASRRSELRRLLVGLGIPGVGAGMATDLAERFGSLRRVMNADAPALAAVRGIGPVASSAIRGFFADRRTRRVAENLLARGVRGSPASSRRTGVLAGRRFVFTGGLEKLSRKDAEGLVESLGARASSTVTRDTDWVVVGSDSGQKLQTARRLGLRQLTEAQFLALVRRAGEDV